ncbi:HlyD family type I secretion periplasmic adaptor subunit [Saccharophagus degradans]|uniref:Membrane fusion protein (MFP) family protein n=1 Tax=Saccharophagus degradans (strain 2-40 / ATCC 43961 / DSM 17024) TaxID=203122 RepID=Q21L75_SACD2|nr:HlyD family type I secretion periplasmic adaptor subunit [Saccharophagus degradans]ABD80554.1 Type I secretion membrane fusion protein, HlyD [Saccharophagus degradans 2-40]WGO97252.1 HlyD family type I secretion periplasmic adaptor subunit [Saccharophagus degradans]
MSAKKRLGSVFQSIADMAANSVDSPLPPADLDYITSARAAVLEQSPKGGRYVLWAVVVFFVVTVLWASWAELDEFARGEGKVIPSQYVQVVQNLEGGILAELYVREGERVARGEKLLRIDDTQFASSLREAGVTLAQWELKSMRLRAESNGEAFKPEIKKGWPQFLVDQELAYYQSRQQELAGNKEIYDQQLTQRKQELAELEARKEQLQRSYNLLNQELQMTRPLVSQGAISEVELLRLERQVNDLLGELEAAQLAIPRVKSSLDEAKEKLASVDIVFRREAQEELNKVTLELSRLQETSEALVDRVKRTMVISPVAGTVKQLLVKTIGGVIQPGMDIVEIVPSEEIMLVEARVRPADIGYLHPGQKAKVKFSAYDFSVMGGLDGEVVHISPDTIQDEDGDSFYLVRIETSRTFIGPDGRELPIIPGMTVSVDILTGKKTILDYLLKPILKTKQLAMSER